MIKYLADRTQILFAEVPDEISLGISITSCGYKCRGCHSPELQKDIGEELTVDIMRELINRNKGITCVCFLGDGNDPESMLSFVSYAQVRGLKICIYTARSILHLYDGLYFDLMHRIDYIKTGAYVEKLGGLSSPDTNQQFFRVIKGKIGDNITSKFQRDKRTL